MLEMLRKFFSRNATTDGLDQVQREAMIDLLLICIYADNDLDLNEERIFDREVEHYAWLSETSLKDYIQAARVKVQGMIASKEARRSAFRDIAQRLRTREAKYGAVKMCKLLFYADCQLDDEEETFIDEIELALGGDS